MDGGYLLKTKLLRVVDVELILFLVACRPVRRFSLFLEEALLRGNPVNLVRVFNARRLVRSKRDLSHANGSRRSTRKAVRTICRTRGCVPQLLMLLLSVVLCHFGG